jgi:hypothetical protein
MALDDRAHERACLCEYYLRPLLDMFSAAERAVTLRRLKYGSRSMCLISISFPAGATYCRYQHTSTACGHWFDQHQDTGAA